MILATSRSATHLINCMKNCIESIQSEMYVQDGYKARLIINDEFWDTLPVKHQDYIINEINSMIKLMESQ